MANHNYARGASAERLAKAELEADGYAVIRAAGSKGKCDLFAAKLGELLLIQVKTGSGRVTPEERAFLRTLQAQSGGRAQIWTRVRGGWTKEDVVDSLA